MVYIKDNEPGIIEGRLRLWLRPRLGEKEHLSIQNGTGWADPSSLYLHVPFCPYKCPYCDFVTYVGGEAMVEPYVDAICTEIRQIALDRVIPLHTLYFGGGTPSLLKADQVARIIGEVSD